MSLSHSSIYFFTLSTLKTSLPPLFSEEDGAKRGHWHRRVGLGRRTEGQRGLGQDDRPCLRHFEALDGGQLHHREHHLRGQGERQHPRFNWSEFLKDR